MKFDAAKGGRKRADISTPQVSFSLCVAPYLTILFTLFMQAQPAAWHIDDPVREAELVAVIRPELTAH